MKRILSFSLALLLVICLTACGGDSASDSGNSESIGSITTVPADGDIPDKEKDITFEETVVVDNEKCAIKLIEIDETGIWGYTLKAELENKSEDESYMFSIRNASVDGVQSDPFWATEVAAGKKSIETISFSDDTLSENGIKFTDLMLNFVVYNSETWDDKYVANTSLHIYPYGEENAVTFVREPKNTDTILIETDNVTVRLTDIEEDGFWGYTLYLFIENKTNTTLMVSADDVSVNGYMCDPYYAESVGANMCAFSSLSWYTDDFEALGITSVDEIEMVLRAHDYDNWNAKDFAKEKITLYP